MRTVCFSRAVVAGPAIALAVSGLVEVAGQELPRPLQIAATVTSDLPALRRFDALVETLAAGGELVLVSSRPDAQLQGRTHQFLQQFHEGVPVYGAGVSRQQAGGATVSLLGTIETGIELDTQPRFQSAEALERLEQQTGVGPLANALPELVILRVPSGRFVLAYRAAMRDLRTYFLDAHSGSIAHDESMVHEQVVGSGPGIRGQQRKISTSQAGGRFEAIDRLRPAEIVTLDLRANEDHMFDLISREAVWAPGDVASDADNVWSDPAVVDGHAYVGFTYDYLATRQGWRGMVRFLVGEFEDNKTTFFSSYGSVDGENIVSLGFIFYDGVHWNSTVLSHAFYLAIEGGAHETTGLTVPGVGGDRRHDIETVFFRAMTELMPPRANVEIAAEAVRVAAIDLFGAGSDVFAAVHQALNAVGLGIDESDE